MKRNFGEIVKKLFWNFRKVFEKSYKKLERNLKNKIQPKVGRYYKIRKKRKIVIKEISNVYSKCFAITLCILNKNFIITFVKFKESIADIKEISDTAFTLPAGTKCCNWFVEDRYRNLSAT